jgi:hypothetical protein
MGIGIGAALLAIGLILALAVQDTINNVDLTAVGWILAGVGVLALLLGTYQSLAARRSEHRVIEDRNIHAD